jgi:hypothetical protein
MSSLIKSVKADPNYLKFTRIFESIKKRVDLEASLNEALSLHASRSSRNITGENRYSPKVLIDASLKDLSFRARLVELRVKNDLQLSILREAIDAMRRHISTEYSEDLRDFSTADQRKSFVDRALKSSKEFLAEGEAFLETADALIKDIDQAGHSVRHIIECLKLLDSSKAGRVV